MQQGAVRVAADHALRCARGSARHYPWLAALKKRYDANELYRPSANIEPA